MSQDADFFAIDMNALHEELQVHAKNYYMAAQELAQSRKELEEAKARTEVVSAEIGLDIRTDPTKYSIEKITENAIQSTIMLQGRYQKALQAEIDARHEAEIHQVNVTALTEKGKAIGKAVDLFLASYWAVDPKVSRKNKEWADNSRTDAAFGTKNKKKDVTDRNRIGKGR